MRLNTQVVTQTQASARTWSPTGAPRVTPEGVSFAWEREPARVFRAAGRVSKRSGAAGLAWGESWDAGRDDVSRPLR